MKSLTVALLCFFSSQLFSNQLFSSQAPSNHTATDNVLKFVVDEFPPYQYLDHEGLPAGLCVDLLKQVYRQLNQPIEIDFLPWQRVQRMFARGEYAGQLCIGLSAERQALGTFSDKPLADAHFYAFKNKNNANTPDIQQLQDFDHYSIGVTKGYTYSEPIWQYFSQHQNKSMLSDDKHGLKMLNYHRFDYMLADKRYVAYQMPKLAMKQENLVLASVNPMLILPMYVLFNRELVSEQQVARFSAAFAQLQNSSTYQTIVARYESQN